MFATGIPEIEFNDRIKKCQTEAERRGFAGLIVCARGGGTYDRYANVDYLANFYQQRCYLPDFSDLWSGRSHCLLVIPVVGDPILVVSSPEHRDDLIAVNDVRFKINFIENCKEVIRELEIDDQKVGLIGGDVLTFNHGRQLVEKLPNMTLVEADEILTEMREIKSPREIESIKEACRVGSEALEVIMNNVSANKTEAEIIAPGVAHTVANGAVLYFTVTNSGPYADYAHSIDFAGYDSVRKLNDGDIFKIDFIIAYQGYLCDFGRTMVVGGNPSKEQQQSLDIVTDAVDHVIESVQPGMSVNQLCQIGDDYLQSRGVSLSSDQTDPSQLYAAYPPHWGHGLGMTWERPWFVEEEDTIIQSGMYLAIEKSLHRPGMGTVFFEQNILITDEGCDVLTKTHKRWYEA